ncbi:hypothetical protein DFA_10924 [Cavenderia fasciculata]|uniref:DUF6314 domain-containing protein n=1 Tax=Cavenderia fasciculata TaxID=261658 RepID=F4QBS8_CACFS|nr:uncharacterized protein DFA_10924 [Cavenderia fasciculata]EGG14666.1 hypothetical protein DFA_10924 [Cavenderia fasciculata]|eukprot:XP_004351174.1 hypothetical protein DFA_10924 [Cavenderia fasciculata]
MQRIFKEFIGRWNINRKIIHKLVADNPNNTNTQSCLLSAPTTTTTPPNLKSFGEQKMTVTGSATFVPLDNDSNTLRYTEEGVLEQEDTGARYPVNQKYIYRYDEQADRISVYFDETPERLLHTLIIDQPQPQPNTLFATGHHPCGDDTYNATYQFEMPQHRFTLTYNVSGPNKNYQMSTIFTK